MINLPTHLNARLASADSTPLGAPAPASDESRLRVAAQRFEGYFIGQMLQQMRHSTAVLADADSAINDRVNADMLDLADQTLGDDMARQRAFGIADALVRQLLPPAAAVDAAAAVKPFALKTTPLTSPTSQQDLP